MRQSTPFALALGAALLFAATVPVAAQQTESPPTSGSDRMFLNFFQDATVVDGQWWEGRLEYADFDEWDTTVLRGVAAFGVADNLEIGGTVGFGDSNTSGSLPEGGSGATDLEGYAKYYFGSHDGRSEFAAGGTMTIPTGDDAVGLGLDSFALGGFGSLRYRLKRIVLGGNIGFQVNSDGSIFGSPDVDGEFSAYVGFGAILHLADRLSVVAETRFQTEQFKDTDQIFDVLAGLNWRISNRGQVRAAADFNIEDTGPDWRATVGYAHVF